MSFECFAKPLTNFWHFLVFLPDSPFLSKSPLLKVVLQHLIRGFTKSLANFRRIRHFRHVRQNNHFSRGPFWPTRCGDFSSDLSFWPDLPFLWNSPFSPNSPIYRRAPLNISTNPLAKVLHICLFRHIKNCSQIRLFRQICHFSRGPFQHLRNFAKAFTSLGINYFNYFVEMKQLNAVFFLSFFF